jgi:hypothetical protein
MPVVQLVMHFPDLVIISLIAFHELCTGDHKEMSSILADYNSVLVYESNGGLRGLSQ